MPSLSTTSRKSPTKPISTTCSPLPKQEAEQSSDSKPPPAAATSQSREHPTESAARPPPSAAEQVHATRWPRSPPDPLAPRSTPVQGSSKARRAQKQALASAPTAHMMAIFPMTSSQ
jgi:hypothetical protein